MVVPHDFVQLGQHFFSYILFHNQMFFFLFGAVCFFKKKKKKSNEKNSNRHAIDVHTTTDRGARHRVCIVPFSRFLFRAQSQKCNLLQRLHILNWGCSVRVQRYIRLAVRVRRQCFPFECSSIQTLTHFIWRKTRVVQDGYVFNINSNFKYDLSKHMDTSFYNFVWFDVSMLAVWIIDWMFTQ